MSGDESEAVKPDRVERKLLKKGENATEKTEEGSLEELTLEGGNATTSTTKAPNSASTVVVSVLLLAISFVITQ